jgi:hypothetical protein
MFGNKVVLHLNPPYSGEAILRNVTEIHYNYNADTVPVLSGRIAFESDIHGTGIVYAMKDVREFQVTPETKKAEAF